MNGASLRIEQTFFCDLALKTFATSTEQKLIWQIRNVKILCSIEI